jgi:glycosyltransferase involved in cell wall biosynthesis
MHRGALTCQARGIIRRRLGVNVAGHLSSEKGVGEAVRSTIRILEAAQIPYILNNFHDPGAVNNDNTFTNFSEQNPYRVNLIVLGTDALPHFVREKGRQYFANHWNIGHWAWELADFPREWFRHFQLFDEVWVASSFVQEALARLAPIPVSTVPYTLTGEMPPHLLHRFHFGLPKDTFVFLFIFDFHSYVERKNPLGLIEAFKRAFSPKEDVLLILKCSHADWAPSALKSVQEASRGANIRITDCILSREQIRTLIYLSDCYISLHRAEGFGLTMAEAMSMERPVIATGYSGNTHFMTANNSFLVDYKLIPIEQDHGPYKRGFVWADPDLDRAAELIRFVYENREVARETGRRARQDVLATLRPEVVGAEVRKKLLKVPR